MGRLDRKVTLITGAGSGIGEATARRFVAEGGRVVVTDRIRATGEAVAASLGEAAFFQPLDVTQEVEWTAALEVTVARFGRLDVLVNNAGVGVVKDVESTTLEEWRFVHAVNTEGVFLGCREAIKAMKVSGGGSIVNVSSIAGIVGEGTLAAYCSSKGAVRSLTKSIAMHCARRAYGIRCNSVHPSFIATAMVDAMVEGAKDPESARAKLAGVAPLGRLGDVDDVAYMILYLASDESKFVTGAEMMVDGGTTAR